jgi:hypothetical protein
MVLYQYVFLKRRCPALLNTGCVERYFRQKQTRGTNTINIDRVMCDDVSGVFVNPIRGVRIVETSGVVRRGDIDTNLMTGIPNI